MVWADTSLPSRLTAEARMGKTLAGSETTKKGAGNVSYFRFFLRDNNTVFVVSERLRTSMRKAGKKKRERKGNRIKEVDRMDRVKRIR